MKILFCFFMFANAALSNVLIEGVDGKKATGYLGLGDPVYAEHRQNAIPLPPSFDWVSQGKVTPIRDQGQCGSCYAFSITKAFESALMIQAGKTMLDLSEQQIVSCAKAYGCGGGFMDTASYVVSPGLTDEQGFAYTGRNSRCRAVSVKEKAIKYELLGSPNKKPTVDEIKTAIITYGPVFVTVAAGGNGWSGETGEVTGCRNRGVNHMVTIVGYTADNKWIVANSWGTSWGNNGYTLMKFGCDQIAGDAGIIIVDNSEID